MAYTFELETTVIGRHALGVHETFGTVRSIFTTLNQRLLVSANTSLHVCDVTTS